MNKGIKKVKVFFEPGNLIRIVSSDLVSKEDKLAIERFSRKGMVDQDSFWDFRDSLSKMNISLTVDSKSKKVFEDFKKQKSVILDMSKSGSMVLRYVGKERRISSLVRKISPKGWILEPLNLNSFLLDLRSLGGAMVYTERGQDALKRFKEKNSIEVYGFNNEILLKYSAKILSKHVLVLSDYVKNKILIDPVLLDALVYALRDSGCWVDVQEDAKKINKISSLNSVSFAPSAKFFNQIEVFPKAKSMSQKINKICSPFLDKWSTLKSPKSLSTLAEKLDDLKIKFNIHPLARRISLLDLEISGNFDQDILRLPLIEYQKEGALFLAKKEKALLGDEMGLGKTVQAIAAIEILKSKNEDLKVLIVVPASLRTQWKEEFRKFTGREVDVVRGTPKARKGVWDSENNIKIVNYEILMKDKEAKVYCEDCLLVLDECQRIKNWKTKTNQLVRSYNFRYCFALSGTPLENSIEDLYTVMRAVQPNALGRSPFPFRKKYLVLDRFGSVLKVKNIDEIRRKISGVFLRRRKDQVMESLPDLLESVRYVKLSASQKKIYEKIFKKVYQSWKDDDDSEKKYSGILEGVLRMREACASPELLKEDGDSSKLNELMDIIESGNVVSGKKMIVFTQWVRMGKIICSFLKEKNINSVFYHGGLNQVQRDGVIEDFKNSKESNILVATDAASHGLNLQFVNFVVNFELLYNPAKMAQRVARAHRIGGKNSVLAIHLVSENTIEERILSILKKKKDLFNQVLESKDFSEKVSQGIFSKKELIDFLLS